MGLKVCENQCNQCLFSKNRIVSKSRMTEILKSCSKKDNHFLCHKGTLAGKEVVCKGFYDAYDSQMIVIAKRLNVIEFVKPELLNQ